MPKSECYQRRERGENIMDVEVARDGDWVGNTGIIGGGNSDYRLSMKIGQNCMNGNSRYKQ